MDVPDPTPPATPPPTPDPAPPAPPATPAAPAPAPAPAAPAQKVDPFIQRVMSDIGVTLGELPPAPPVIPPMSKGGVMTIGDNARFVDERRKLKAEAPPAAPATPAAPQTPPAAVPDTPAPADPAPPKVSVRKGDTNLQRAVDDALNRRQPPAPAAPPAPATPPPPAPDTYESTLSDIQLEELELARYAAKKDPTKYGTWPERLLKFYKQMDAYIQAGAEKDSGRTFDSQDEDYQKFIRTNRPAIPSNEIKKLEYAKIKDEAVEEAKKTNSQEIEDLKRENREMKIRPRIESIIREFEGGLNALLKESTVASEIMAQVETHGWQAAIDSNPIFGRIVAGLHQQAVNVAAEYAALASGATSLNLKNPSHNWIVNFINGEGRRFAKHGGDQITKGGKTFLPRDLFFELAEKNAKKATDEHWTWDDRDILSRLAIVTRENVDEQITEEAKNLEKAGFTRQQPRVLTPPPAVPAPLRETPPPTPAPAPPAPGSVRVSASAAPGLAKSVPLNQRKALSEREIALLVPGVKVPA